MNTEANHRSGLARAIRTVTMKDFCLSIGLAAVVLTLTSVMGRF